MKRIFKKTSLLTVIILFSFIAGLLVFNNKYALRTSNEAYSGRIFKSSDYVKALFQKQLNETPSNTAMPNVSIWIIHQFPNDTGENDRTYRTTDFTFERSIGGGAKEFYFADNTIYSYPFPNRFYLGYRYERQNYLIELTPQQQRELVTKLYDIGYFDLDDLMDINVLARARRGKDNYLNMDLTNKEYFAIQANMLVYADTTAKNKAVIMQYKNWLDSKYKTELLKHPVDKWPED